MTRRLGPEGYGLLTLASMLVAWIEWSITSVFARATIKFVGQAEDWRPIGVLVMRLHLGVSLMAALAFWFLATPLATLLNEPVLTIYLRLFALDIPLFSLAHAHRHILIGIGAFRQRALASARIFPPVGTLGRSVLIGGMVYVLAILWPASGSALWVKLSLLSCMICVIFLILGEFSRSEIRQIRAMLGWQTVPKHEL